MRQEPPQNLVHGNRSCRGGAKLGSNTWLAQLRSLRLVLCRPLAVVASAAAPAWLQNCLAPQQRRGLGSCPQLLGLGGAEAARRGPQRGQALPQQGPQRVRPPGKRTRLPSRGLNTPEFVGRRDALGGRVLQLGASVDVPACELLRWHLCKRARSGRRRRQARGRQPAGAAGPGRSVLPSRQWLATRSGGRLRRCWRSCSCSSSLKRPGLGHGTAVASQQWWQERWKGAGGGGGRRGAWRPVAGELGACGGADRVLRY